MTDDKIYWVSSTKKLWDKMKVMTPEELLNLLQDTCDQLSGYTEDDFAITLLRKHLGLKYSIPDTNTKEFYIDCGCPKNEILEVQE